LLALRGFRSHVPDSTATRSSSRLALCPERELDVGLTRAAGGDGGKIIEQLLVTFPLIKQLETILEQPVQAAPAKLGQRCSPRKGFGCQTQCDGLQCHL